MAVVARARRARRGARRAAPRVVGLAFLALAFSVGGWNPATAAPLLATPGPAVSVPASADPVDLVAPIAAAPVGADAVAAALPLSAAAAHAVDRSFATIAQPVPAPPVDARPLALPVPVDVPVAGRAVGSAAGPRAPPHAV